MGTAVELSNYTSGMFYSFPTHGYLCISTNKSSGTSLRLYAANDDSFIYLSPLAEEAVALFVRQGMRLEVRLVFGTVSITFRSLI